MNRLGPEAEERLRNKFQLLREYISNPNESLVSRKLLLLNTIEHTLFSLDPAYPTEEILTSIYTANSTFPTDTD